VSSSDDRKPARGGAVRPLGTVSNLRAILFMCAAVSLFPFLNASVKLLSADYPTAQIVWIRYLGHLVFMLIVFMPKHGTGLFRTTQPGSQWMRSVLLLTSTVLYFSALNFVPLTTAAAISFSNPFMITALSVPLLAERVGFRRWTAVVIGFLGALIIIRPGLEGFHWAAILVVGSSFSYALYGVLTRRIAGHDSPATTITYTAIIGALLSSLVGPFYWVTPISLFDWCVFAGLGFFGGLGHFLVVKAFQWGQASVVAPFGYLQLVGATVFGYFLFGDFPDSWTWFGAAIIIACGSYIAYREGVLGRGKAGGS